MHRDQKVQLGCGTLILIALIVIIFGNSGQKDLERKIDSLESRVRTLQTAIQSQSAKREMDNLYRQIEQLQQTVQSQTQAIQTLTDRIADTQNPPERPRQSLQP